MKIHTICESERVCANCRYYYQHYIYDKEMYNGFSSCNCGHCSQKRLKRRKPSDTCENFERR